MKSLYNINSWSILITVLLIFTFWGGIIALPILGIIQIALSLRIIEESKSLNGFIKKLFISYIITTAASILLIKYINQYYFNQLEIMFLWVIISIALAFFHLFITYKIKQS